MLKINFPQYKEDLYERSGNTDERLADCTLYDGAALWIHLQDNRKNDIAKRKRRKEKIDECVELYGSATIAYEEANQLINKHAMQLKQSIILILIGKVVDGEKILIRDRDENSNHTDLKLYDNEFRNVLLRELAWAVLELKQRQSPDKLKDFLKRFPCQNSLAVLTNSADQNNSPDPNLEPFPRIEVGRRENLEIWLFASELLLRYRLAGEEEKCMNDRNYTQAIHDSQYLISALAVFQQVCDQKTEQLKFINRYTKVLKDLEKALEEAQKKVTGNRLETVNQ